MGNSRADSDTSIDWDAYDKAAMDRMEKLEAEGKSAAEIAVIMEEEYPDFMEIFRSLASQGEAE